MLQSRPNTTHKGFDLATGDHNDSLRGDYLWSSTNFGEAFPDVMTPLTWSLVKIYMDATAPFYLIFNDPMVGNIGGRLYMNVSLGATLSQALGMDQAKWRRDASNTFGRIPPEMDVPILPLNRWKFLRKLVPLMLRFQRRIRRHQKELLDFLATAAATSESLDKRISQAATELALVALWREELLPFFIYCSQILHAATNLVRTPTRKFRPKLIEMVGEADTNALLSGVSPGSDALASLGPLLGLWKVAHGEMTRVEYISQFGHRSAHEFEVSIPRPAEDPNWLEDQLTALQAGDFDPPAMLAQRQRQAAAAWARFVERYPRQSKTTRGRLDNLAATAKMRESVRSEVTRAFWLFRKFGLRAGELSALDDGIFFLYIDEILALLAGDRSSAAFIPARQETHGRYSALPPYPNLIRGRFDPVQWAQDPMRRTDIYEPHRSAHSFDMGDISGFPGAAGIVEGTVRVLMSPEEGGDLKTGEILVANTTNIGWTPIFPRASAVVTDIGAPLSHAAIVARELGIPAVVGCGDATMRLKSGDRVRVDGGQGKVTLFPPS